MVGGTGASRWYFSSTVSLVDWCAFQLTQPKPPRGTFISADSLYSRLHCCRGAGTAAAAAAAIGAFSGGVAEVWLAMIVVDPTAAAAAVVVGEGRGGDGWEGCGGGAGGGSSSNVSTDFNGREPSFPPTTNSLFSYTATPGPEER